MSRILITGAGGAIGQSLLMSCRKRWPDAEIFGLSRKPLAMPGVSSFVCDVSRQDEAERARVWLLERTQKLDLLIHCLGVLNGGDGKPEKNLNDIDEEAVLEAFRINALSAIHVGAKFKSFFRTKDRSVLLFVSAKVGSIGDNQLGGWYAYRMSKAALNMGVRNMALEYKRSGCASILVAVHPGTTLTNFSEGYVKNWDPAKLSSADQTADRLLDLSENLTREQSGNFFHWDGSPLPF